MDDGVNKEDNKSLKMGASSNPSCAKIASLQEKKKQIEEKLAKHNLELRQLCLQEAELTGMMPVEYPLEPGETPPLFRRRIGTSFQLPQNLINNFNSEEEISAIELEIQFFAKMAEAALGLANENIANKNLRRKHMIEYEAHKQRNIELEEKLQFLKKRSQRSQQPKQPSPNQQLKLKKKPRPLDQETDTISMNVNLDPFGKTPLRHSLRSLQHAMNVEGSDNRYSIQSQKLVYRGSDSSSLNENVPHYLRSDDLSPTFCRLNINGFKNYVEREENVVEQIQNNQFIHAQSSNSLYKHPSQYINPSHTLPHAARRSPQSVSHTYTNTIQYNINPHSLHNRQASPSTSSNSSIKYYPTQPQQTYRQYVEPSMKNLNAHQLQPHQQYEHDGMSSGLGGYWKRAENGEIFWCNSSNNDIIQKDKSFGSLDRRKNKHIQKRISPNVDPKSATLATVQTYHEPRKPQQVVNRHRQDNRQLVRTQSLGSVGGQTIDSVCPSDDNSSCGSETLSYSEHRKNIRRQKQKEWYETSLDGPAVATPSRSHSTVPSIAPEDKYIDFSSSIPSPHTPVPPPPQSPQTPKPIFEIPAESNPSPRTTIDTNLEIFNNNVPRNCTVVQPALWKPYHEETKPFEMADFYKYSTKFNKSPQKTPQDEGMRSRSQSIGFRNLPSPQSTHDYNDDDNASVIQKGVYQPLQPMKCQPFSPTNNSNVSVSDIGCPISLNASLDLSQLAPNIAENFSAEMKAWYQNHEHQNENNNATLV